MISRGEKAEEEQITTDDPIRRASQAKRSESRGKGKAGVWVGGWEGSRKRKPIRGGRTRQCTSNIEHPHTQPVTTNKKQVFKR